MIQQMIFALIGGALVAAGVLLGRLDRKQPQQAKQGPTEEPSQAEQAKQPETEIPTDEERQREEAKKKFQQQFDLMLRYAGGKTEADNE